MKTSFCFAGMLLGVAVTGAFLFRPGSLAGEDSKPIDFIRDIRPIFQARCHSCHGPTKQKGELRLDRKGAALKGGDSGPVILPGKSAASLLLARVTSTEPREQMPPRDERLTAEQVQLLRAWIDQGAPWPE